VEFFFVEYFIMASVAMPFPVKVDKLVVRRIKRDAVNELSAKQIIKENQLNISVRAPPANNKVM
jgi:hypothetical protein